MDSKKATLLRDSIIHAYEKNVFYLSLSGAGHFFERAFRITGNKKYENIIAWHLKENKVKSIRVSLEKLKSNNFLPEKLPLQKNKLSKRKALREELYKKNPEIKFFNALLVDMLFCKISSLDKTVLKKEFKEIEKELKKIDFKKTYLREDVIKKDSSYSFNSSFILKHFGICDITKDAEKMLRDLYLDKELGLKKSLPNHEFKSLIYSMTHIIIADSKFYDRFVANHNWIISFFIKNLDYIIKNVSLDILAEVALCIKLCKKETTYLKEYEKIRDYLSINCQLENLHDTAFIVKKEHTNSILMLLFSEKMILHKGPDLSHHKVFNN